MVLLMVIWLLAASDPRKIRNSNIRARLKTVWGQRIATARLAVPLTQAELAAAMGVGQQQVSKWESGLQAPREEIRLRLARVLGLAPEVLFSYDVEVSGGENAA